MTEEHRLMIDDCEKRSASLTDWEARFIDSISRRDYLSDAQIETLERIWERVT